MNVKPVIFISHSSKDEATATKLREQIKNSLGQDNVEIFVSTDEFRRKSGNWFDTVMIKLDTAKAFIVLVTPASLESQWVWFELGYFKAHDDTKPIYALRTQEIELNTLPGLLKDLHIQVNEIDKSEAVEGVIQQLYETVSISTHMDDGYIKAKLENYFKDHNKRVWFLYRDIDFELGLPEGTSIQYLKEIARQRNYEVEVENEGAIKFKSSGKIIGGPNPFYP